MQLLITGALGFLGRYVVRQGVSRGLPLVAAGRRPPPQPSPVRYVQCERYAPEELFAAVNGPFVLVHLAWNMRRGPAFAGQAEQVARLAALLDAGVERRLEYVVALGSAEEYGGREGTLSDDDAPVGPLSPYGWAKSAAGQLLRDFSQRQGLGAVWLRPMVVYGPGQGGAMVVPYAVRQALRGEAAQFSDGVQQRDFVHAEDIAAAILAAAERRPAGFHAVPLGTGQPTAVREVLGELSSRLGAQHLFQLGAIARRANEPLIQAADTARGEELLAWRAQIDWRSGIARYCEALSDPVVRAAAAGHNGEASWDPRICQPTAAV